MTVDFKRLKDHPSANPDYAAVTNSRLSAQAHNRAQKDAALRGKPHLPFVAVPKQPNKYVPHIGAKQRAKRGYQGHSAAGLRG